MELWQLVGDRLWNPWLLALFLITGLYYSLRTGFLQLFGVRLWLSSTLGAIVRGGGAGGRGLTQFQALATALGATIGTGSVAGVATAIFWGGPGAVFWMWVSAFLGMMTGCAEKTLALYYRRRGADGAWRGGPMEYMAYGLGWRAVAAVYAVFCGAATLTGGGMVQANSIATALEASFGLPRLGTGMVTALLVGAVIFGGIRRIGRVSEGLVPAMAVLFLAGGGVVLWHNAAALPGALEQILRCALTPRAALGGGMGYGVGAALRYGVARGVFTNEAGLGSSAMAHASAETKEPAEGGMWGIFEVFVATLVICTVTALVILTTGVYCPEEALTAIAEGAVTDGMQGAPLASAAFGTVLGNWGGGFVAVCLLLFAFSSLLGWGYYGQRSAAWLAGEGAVPVFQAVFLVAVVAGSVGDMTLVWLLTDACNALMAIPNLAALLVLAPRATVCINGWCQAKARGRGG